jgi:hypothetical protein
MCEFIFNHSKDPQHLFERAKAAITGNGGNLTGTESSGSFSIEKFGMSVEGRYEIGATEVKLFVDNKPFFVSCQQIENMIQAQFS